MNILKHQDGCPDVELRWIPRSSVIGQERETSDFLDKVGFVPDLDLDPGAWDGETLHNLFLWQPLVVLERRAGYVHLGTGRMLRLAEETPAGGVELPAFLIKKKKLSRETKLKLLAAELFGAHALAKTRRHLPNRMYQLWEQFRVEGIETILGDLPTDFAYGSGYSLKAITGSSGRKSDALPHVQDSEQEDDGAEGIEGGAQ